MTTIQSKDKYLFQNCMGLTFYPDRLVDHNHMRFDHLKMRTFFKESVKYLINYEPFASFSDTLTGQAAPLTIIQWFELLKKTMPFSSVWVEFVEPVAYAQHSDDLDWINQEPVIGFRGVGYDGEKLRFLYQEMGDHRAIYGERSNYEVMLGARNRDNAILWLAIFALSNMLEYIQPEYVDAVCENFQWGHRLRSGKSIEHVSRIVKIYRKQPNQKTFTGGKSSVDWQHRWHVKGHWRRVKGIGHDADGNEVNGFTWVSPCIKGPEDKPLINKVRLVKDSLP
jgi:hypothetical protein